MKKTKEKRILISFIVPVFFVWLFSFVLIINIYLSDHNGGTYATIEAKEVTYPITNLSPSSNCNIAMALELEEDNTLKTNTNAPVYKKDEKNIKVPVLIYHEVQETIPGDDIYNLYITTERLEENITTLLTEGYTFITFEHLYKYNNGEIGLPEKSIILTLDDGWRGNYTYAFPIFKKYNICATIFVVTDAMESEQYLTWEQAKEMYDSGLVKIYSHGKRHIDYTTVSKQELIDDILYSHSQIEEHLDTTVFKAFAYPSGRVTSNTKQWLNEIGFETQILTKYGTVNKSTNLDLTDIGRIRCQQDVTGEKILKTINNVTI